MRKLQNRRGVDWSDKKACAEYQRRWQRRTKKPLKPQEIKVKPPTLVCRGCTTEKPFTEEFFYASKASTSSLQKQCKACYKRTGVAARWGIPPTCTTTTYGTGRVISAAERVSRWASTTATRRRSNAVSYAGPATQASAASKTPCPPRSRYSVSGPLTPYPTPCAPRTVAPWPFRPPGVAGTCGPPCEPPRGGPTNPTT